MEQEVNKTPDAQTSRDYKDRLFRFIFEQEMFRKDLLDLYNALNGTKYTNYEDLEINTLHDTIYMKMKNDVSFLFHSVISLYEHQSSFNPNMPYRQFQYCAKLYEKLMVQNDADLYGRKLVNNC